MNEPPDDPTKAALVASLQHQREHILTALAAMEPASLRQAALPTGWTPLGLVQHLALDVERFWFRMIMDAQSPRDEWTEASDAAWSVAPEVPADAVIALYREEIDQANAIIWATRLDAPPQAWPGDLFGDWRLPDLRAMLLHAITETACHAGHLDAARELIDGGTWLILT